MRGRLEGRTDRRDGSVFNEQNEVLERERRCVYRALNTVLSHSEGSGPGVGRGDEGFGEQTLRQWWAGACQSTSLPKCHQLSFPHIFRTMAAPQILRGPKEEELSIMTEMECSICPGEGEAR